MVDWADARSRRRDGHLQYCQPQVGAQMILHRPAHDPAAIDVQDGGQIEMDAPPGASRFGLARISLLTQYRGGFSGGRQATMAKELRTAQELSDMIVSALGV